jgi:carbamoylphosphate synthase large subunit
MIQTEFVRKDVALVNTDVSAYRSAVARKEQDKYIKNLEVRICKLECAMQTLENTVKEISK